MAFVNEEIQEKDREYFNSFNFTNPVTDISVKAVKWTIDRKKDAFLIRLGGQGLEFSEIPMFYAFVWQNNVITVETFRKGRGDAQSGIELFWRMSRIEIPESLKQEKDMVIKLIKEAFDTYGNGINRRHVKKINFEVIKDPVYTSDVCKPVKTEASEKVQKQTLERKEQKHERQEKQKRSWSDKVVCFIKEKISSLKKWISSLSFLSKMFYFVMLVVWMENIALNFTTLFSTYRFIQFTSLLILGLSFYSIIRNFLLFITSFKQPESKKVLKALFKTLAIMLISVIIYGITL